MLKCSTKKRGWLICGPPVSKSYTFILNQTFFYKSFFYKEFSRKKHIFFLNPQPAMDFLTFLVLGWYYWSPLWLQLILSKWYLSAIGKILPLLISLSVSVCVSLTPITERERDLSSCDCRILYCIFYLNRKHISTEGQTSSVLCLYSSTVRAQARLLVIHFTVNRDRLFCTVFSCDNISIGS